MSKVVKIVAGAALSAVTGGVGGLAFSWGMFAGSLVLGGLSYALTPKPKKPSFDNSLTNKGTTVAVRQPDLTRQLVYGHTRITRGYAHMESTGLNGKLHMILMLCEGPLRAINEIWINDYCIPNDWIDDEGNVVAGRYSGYLTIRKHLGTETQGADTLAMANMGTWTSSHRLAGIAYLYVIMTKDQDVYPTGVPNISAIVEGPVVYDPRIEDETWTTNIALFNRDFLTNDVYGFGVDIEDIDDVNISAQANICDEFVTTEAIDHTIDEVNLVSNQIAFSQDILKFQYGDRVQLVVQDGVAPGGISPGVDYYVIPYQILTNPRIQLATSFENALAKVAIDITSTGSGLLYIRKTGEPRYHGGGAIDTETNLSESMSNLASSMAGRALSIGGFWTLLAGAWRTPTLDLGIEEMRGPMSFKNALSMSESFNIVKGLFISSVSLYQQTDYPSARYSEFIDQDNGLEAPKELNLPFTNRPTTAQRIAKIELFRGRQDIVFNADFSTTTLQLQPGDNISLTVDRLGWEEKEFEITQYSFDVNNGSLVTRLTLRETAEAIFDWTNGEAISFDPAPNTNLPNPFLVLVPTGVAYNSRAIDTAAADQVFILVLQWDQHPDSFVTQFGDFEIQYKLSESSDWLPSFFVDGMLMQTDVTSSSPNVEYDLRIRARNNLGVRSGWVTITGAVVGSSGGVGTTYDYEYVTDSISTFNDWGNVTDAPTSFEDWGFVA